MNLKKLIAAVGLATLASTSFAKTLDFGNVASVPDGSYFAQGFIEHATAGAFTDYILFSLSNPSFDSWLGLGTLSDQPKADGSNITGMTAKLYQDFGTAGAGGGDMLVANLGAGDYISNGGPLGTGAYFFEISGMAVGPSAVAYGYTASVTPVPEPETYAMMLAGLVMLGGVAARRKGRNA